MKVFTVKLKRNNGRLVKQRKEGSKYRAKLLKREWENKYDPTYYVEIER